MISKFVLQSILLITALFGFVFFFLQKDTFAQSCSGSVTCGSTVRLICRDVNTGSNCAGEHIPNCSCSNECSGVSTTRSCSFFPTCSDGCGVYEGVCTISGSCNYTPPPPPTATPPGATPPPGSCTSGDAFTGISNCGEVGRTSGSGSCGANCLCCASTGGGSSNNRARCEYDSDADVLLASGALNIGDPFAVRVRTDLSPSSCEVVGAGGFVCVDYIRATSNNPSVIDYDGLRVKSSWAGGFNDDNFYGIAPATVGTVVGPGTAGIEVQTVVRRCPTCAGWGCYWTRNFTVAGAPVGAPNINIISPSSPHTTSIGSNVNIVANAVDTDGGSITQVQFFQGSTSLGFGTDIGGDNYTINWAPTAQGNYSVTARATDDSGLVGVSGPLAINVLNNEPPEVVITYPTPSTAITAGEIVNIIAVVTDDTAVSQVNFFIDGVLLGPGTRLGTSDNYYIDWPVTSNGSSLIRAEAIDNEGASNFDEVTVNAQPPRAWFQIGGGSIIAKSNITSSIPAVLASEFILDDAISGRPGVPIYNGSLNVGSGVISSTQWQTDTGTAASIPPFSYSYFENLASGKFPSANISGNITSGTFNGAAAPDEAPIDGYVYRRSGSVTINQPLNINRKAILFVDGDLTINNQIRLNAAASSDRFFMAIVRGNINVSPTLSSPNVNTPAIEGMFFADGEFSTGTNSTDDSLLVVRGSVAAQNISLRRDLVDENISGPAEYFQFSPELVVNYPSALSVKHLVWREVAP